MIGAVCTCVSIYSGALGGGANKKMTENASQKTNGLAAMSRLSIADCLLI